MLDFLGYLYSPSTYLGTCQAQSETRSRNSGIKAFPRARFLDWNEVPDLGHPLKLQHMMPSASVFARACSKNALRSLLIQFGFAMLLTLYPGAFGITREYHVVL